MANRKAASRRPATKQDLKENNAPAADAVVSRLSLPQKVGMWLIAVVGGLVAIGQIWAWTGARTPVWDRDLDKVVKEQNVTIDNKLGAVKTEVNKNVSDAKGEITGTLGQLTKTLEAIAKKQDLSAMEQAEQQQRLAFTQKSSFEGQLIAAQQALEKNKNDPFLLQRKMQLEGFIRQTDDYMKDAQNKIQKLRSQ